LDIRAEARQQKRLDPSIIARWAAARRHGLEQPPWESFQAHHGTVVIAAVPAASRKELSRAFAAIHAASQNIPSLSAGEIEMLTSSRSVAQSSRRVAQLVLSSTLLIDRSPADLLLGVRAAICYHDSPPHRRELLEALTARIRLLLFNLHFLSFWSDGGSDSSFAAMSSLI
jgi:hypothetical protein